MLSVMLRRVAFGLLGVVVFQSSVAAAQEKCFTRLDNGVDSRKSCAW
jgi:hypothetical protein